jgi:hypothetical protein
MERENMFKKDEETLDKLFCDREYIPANAIGIMNVHNRDRINDLIEIAKQTYSSEKRQLYFDEVYAYLLKKSEVIEERCAYISEIAGTLFMQFEKAH